MVKKNWLLSIIIVAIIVILLFNTYYDIYRVSSGSMSPTIKTGDYLLIKKIKKSKDGRRNQNEINITKEKIYVFSIPAMKSNIKYFSGEENSKYVKRCVGFPNDTLHFIERQLYINSHLLKEYHINPLKNNNKNNLAGIIYPIHIANSSTIFYPHDSLYSWNFYNIGPLYIPKKNIKIQLTDSMEILYKDIILYETKDISNDTLVTMGEYTFKKDYYYFVGDNFYGSIDSRHWGMIPEENIIGEVKCVLWSESKKEFLMEVE